MVSDFVDPSNTDQLRAWDGQTGDYWTEQAERFDAGVAGYQKHLLAAAAIEPASRVLDIGCGSGRTTRDAARLAPAGSALGVDLSARQLELARRLTGRDGLTNVTFEQADAQNHPFPAGSFDVAVSRHGVMFFGDSLAAFQNIARASRPGGRMALLVWQAFDRNEWVSSFFRALFVGREVPVPPSDAPGPFRLAEPDDVRELLAAAGFDDVRLTGLSEPMYFGSDVDDASRYVVGNFGWALDGLDPAGEARALDALRADLAAHRGPGGVTYDSACWLVEARRP